MCLSAMLSSSSSSTNRYKLFKRSWLVCVVCPTPDSEKLLYSLPSSATNRGERKRNDDDNDDDDDDRGKLDDNSDFVS